MNSLSWFLYLADIIPNIAGFLIFCGVVSTVFWIFIGVFSDIKNSEFPFYGWALNGVSTFKPLFVGFLLFVVANLIPSKETIYLIAGSEAGEYVITSESGQEILDDIHEVIKLQLESLKPNE